MATERDGGGRACCKLYIVASERALRLERVFCDRYNRLYLEDYIILKHYRLSPQEILTLSGLLRANLEKPTHRPQDVPVEVQVCVQAD